MNTNLRQSHGINLCPMPHTNPRGIYLRCLLAVAVFAGLMGSFFSMLEWGLGHIGALSLGGLSAAGFADGFRLVLNRLFTISEQQQAYRYVMFTIQSPQAGWDGYIAAALVAIAVVFAGASVALVYFRSKIFAVATAVLAVGTQIYFGVFPAAAWHIILFTALALTFAYGREAKRHDAYARGRVAKKHVTHAGVIAVIIAVILTSVVVRTTYSGASPAITELSESIRDRFDIRISQITGTPIYVYTAGYAANPDNRDLNVVEVQDEGQHDSTLQDYDMLHDERAVGAEIGALSPLPSLVPLLLAIIAILVIIAVARYLPKYVNVYKRRKMFDTDAPRAAINNMFIHILEWLFVYGMKRENIVFSAYAPQLKGLISSQYAQEYENTVSIWRKAVYSHHTPGEAERAQIKEFMCITMDIVWKNSGMTDKMRIKFKYFL